VKKYDIPNLGKINIRAFSESEPSVPIYLGIIKIKGRKLLSGPFYNAQPDALEEHSLDFVVRTHNKVIFVHHKEKPDLILALVAPEKGIIYPPNKLETKQYYAEILSLFDGVKEILGNDKLKLYR
jgi:hypothetical protein